VGAAPGARGRGRDRGDRGRRALLGVRRWRARPRGGGSEGRRGCGAAGRARVHGSPSDARPRRAAARRRGPGVSEAEVERAVAAIREGRVAVIPTDTVYGLVCSPHDEAAVRALSALKGRATDQPIALVVSRTDLLPEQVP